MHDFNFLKKLLGRKQQLGNWKQPLSFWRHPVRFVVDFGRWFKKSVIWFSASVLSLIVVWVLIFTFDAYIYRESNQAQRNIQLINVELLDSGTANFDVSGLNRDEIEKLLTDISNRQASYEVELIFPDDILAERITADISDLGVKLDIEAVTDSILNQRRNRNFVSHLFGWTKSIITDDSVTAQYEVENAPTSNSQRNIDKLPNLPITIRESKSANFEQVAPSLPLSLLPEIIGREISFKSLEDTGYELIRLRFPSSIAIDSLPIYPQIRNYQMESAIRIANERTSVGLDVLIGGEIRRMSVEQYRSVFQYGLGPSKMLTREIDAALLQENIESLFVDFVAEISQAQIQSLLDGQTLLRLGTI